MPGRTKAGTGGTYPLRARRPLRTTRHQGERRPRAPPSRGLHAGRVGPVSWLEAVRSPSRAVLYGPVPVGFSSGRWSRFIPREPLTVAGPRRSGTGLPGGPTLNELCPQHRSRRTARASRSCAPYLARRSRALRQPSHPAVGVHGEARQDQLVAHLHAGAAHHSSGDTSLHRERVRFRGTWIHQIPQVAQRGDG